MFETLSKGFKAARNRLSGVAELTEENIDPALRDVRLSLLEADVEFGVVKRFLGRVKEKSLGQEMRTSAELDGQRVQVGPAEKFIKICQDELEAMMSDGGEAVVFAAAPKVTGIMMVGLQGAGKTTTSAKLARLLSHEYERKPLLVAADMQRPGAVDQLEVLGESIGIPVFTIRGSSPVEICAAAKAEAKKLKCDTIIYDTAGRLAVDEALMGELAEIKSKTAPENIYLVIDAMIGQDAVKTASSFHERLELSGVVLTKLDGDARGGAALSVKEVTGAPIRFAGMGEQLDKLETFRAEGMAGRILGFGDIVGLMKDFEGVVDQEQAEQDAKRMLDGQFTLDDFLTQIETIQKMGPLKDIFDKLPFFADSMPEGFNLDEGELGRAKAIVSSMTKQERVTIELFKQHPGRISRVAKGSGREEKDVAELLERFGMMRQMMGSIGQSAGLLGKIPGMKQLAGARQLRNAVKTGGLEGNPMMSNLADQLLEAAVAGGGGGAPDMSQLAKMMQGGGMPGMPPGMPGMPPGGMPPGLAEMFGGGAPAPAPRGGKVDKDKKKAMRKQKKKARRKGKK